MKLSICIPTYNRASLLRECLASLEVGPTAEVEVVIVNDGSPDDTSNVVAQFKKTTPASVRYVEQENHGRATALREALLHASGEYIVIIDDDDTFLPNGIDTILSAIADLPPCSDSGRPVAGIAFLCEDENGRVLGARFPRDRFVSNLLAIVADHNCVGDKKQVIRRDVVVPVLYEVPPGERRVATSLLWANVAATHDTIFVNEVVARKKYLPDGLSKNINAIRRRSPVASANVYERQFELYRKAYKSRRFRYKAMINMLRYDFHGRSKRRLRFRGLEFVPFYPLSFLLYMRDRRA